MPTQGEAFDMSILEAMACGLPIVTTTFGGQMDYIKFDENRFYPLSTQKVPAQHTPWNCGYWEKPDLDSLVLALKMVYEQKPKKKSYPYIKNWTWNNSAMKAVKALKKVE